MQSEIAQDIRANYKGVLTSNTRRLTQYQRTLLNPGEQLPAKIPGTWGRRSIIIHRYTTYTVQANISGHTAFIVSPDHIIDSAAASSSSYSTDVASLYDPSVPSVNVNCNSWDNRAMFNLTAVQQKLLD